VAQSQNTFIAEFKLVATATASFRFSSNSDTVRCSKVDQGREAESVRDFVVKLTLIIVIQCGGQSVVHRPLCDVDLEFFRRNREVFGVDGGFDTKGGTREVLVAGGRDVKVEVGPEVGVGVDVDIGVGPGEFNFLETLSRQWDSSQVGIETGSDLTSFQSWVTVGEFTSELRTGRSECCLQLTKMTEFKFIFVGGGNFTGGIVLVAFSCVFAAAGFSNNLEFVFSLLKSLVEKVVGRFSKITVFGRHGGGI